MRPRRARFRTKLVRSAGLRRPSDDQVDSDELTMSVSTVGVDKVSEIQEGAREKTTTARTAGRVRLGGRGVLARGGATLSDGVLLLNRRRIATTSGTITTPPGRRPSGRCLRL